MVYMIFDNPVDKANMQFLYKYNTSSIIQLYPETKCESIKEMINFCCSCLKKTSSEDIIVCWFDFMGVICWWLCKLKLKKRKIIILNILLKNKISLKNKIAKILYRPVIKSKFTMATVTSRYYGEQLNSILHIDKKYTLLHDIYHDSYEYLGEYESVANTVFCGGRNGRNWKLLIEIASRLNNIQFNCVMTKEQYFLFHDSFCTNMNVFYETSMDEFMKLMLSSEIIVMPLDTEAPAGLIAFFQAAANHKLIITSETVTTKEYFAHNRGILCLNNLDNWCEEIDFYLKNKDKRREISDNLKLFLEKECSEEHYTEVLFSLINI